MKRPQYSILGDHGPPNIFRGEEDRPPQRPCLPSTLTIFQSYLCTNPSDNIANVIIGDAQPRAQRIWTMLNLHSMACPVLLHSSSWVDIPKSAMLVVDTLLQNYDDGGALGLSDGIAKAIAGCAAHLHRLSCPHGEMLG